jgi:Domain of unknown function (DUF4404)
MSTPPPPRLELQQTVSRLQGELARSPRVDPAARQRLQQMLEEIERRLRVEERRASDSTGASQGLEHRLESLAVIFEADHPSLAGSLRQLTELLVSAGL